MGKTNVPSETHVIHVPADVTVKNAAAFKETLLEALQTHAKVSLDLSEVEDVDMSFFQLLCAAHKSAMDGGMDFSCGQKDASAAVREAVSFAGFSRHVGCSFSDASSCLWLEED